MGTGKKKIEIKRKEKEADRMVTFSKRRKGLFKKAHQLYTLSGAKIAVLVFSPAGKPYIYGDPSFSDIVDKYYYTSTNTNTNATTSTSSNSTAADNDECKASQEIKLWKAWLGTMDLDGYDNVNDLLVVKNDLEQIRDNLIKRIGQ